MGAELNVALLVLTLTLSSASAWFFKPSDPTVAKANGKPLDDACLALAASGDCEFYKCFEQRLPCGQNGHMLKFGFPYCSRFQQNYHSFTEKGQTFINGSSRCLTKGLLPHYRRSQLDCHDLSHAAFDAISSCYVSNGFCDVLKDDMGALIEIYQPKHLFQTGALKIWREILETTYRCDPDRYHNFANKALNFLSGIVSYFAALG